MTGQDLRNVVDGMMNEGLAKDEVLEILGFSERTLRRYVKMGELDEERVMLINAKLKSYREKNEGEHKEGIGNEGNTDRIVMKYLCPYRREQRVFPDGTQERFMKCTPMCRAYHESGCLMLLKDQSDLGQNISKQTGFNAFGMI